MKEVRIADCRQGSEAGVSRLGGGAEEGGVGGEG